MSLTSSTQAGSRGVPPVAGLDAARIAQQAALDQRFGGGVPPVDIPADQAVRESIIGMSTPSTSGGVPPMGAQGLDPSPFAGRERLAPQEFPDGSDLVGPNTGQQVMRSFDTEDYQMEQANEAARIANFRQGFQQMGTSYDDQGNIISAPDYTSAVGSFLGEGNTIADQLSPRQADKIRTDVDSIDRLQDKQSTALEQITNYGRRFLLTSEGSRDPKSPGTALGYSTMADMGLSLDDMEMTSNIVSMGVMSALAQTRRGDPGTAEAESAVDFDSGTAPYEAVVNAANAMTKPLLNKMGVKETAPGQADTLVAAFVDGLYRDGKLLLNRDPSGKLIATLNQDLMDLRNTVGKTAAMVTAKLGRRKATRSPNISGSLVGEAPKYTAGTILGQNPNTAAATAAKDIMGSTSLKYLVKHVEDISKELQSVLSSEYMDPSGGFSRHPFAERFGLGEKKYKKVLKSVQDRPPRDPAKRDTFNPVAVAIKIMKEEITKAQYDLKAVQAMDYLAFPEMMHSLSNGRFYPASYDVDWLGSKGIIRDVLNFGQRDVVKGKLLFDKEEIARLHSINNRVMSLVGVPRDKAFDALDPADLGALGSMYDAVINYYSVMKPESNVPARSEKEVIGLYTPEIANALADLGSEYNAMRDDPEAFTSDKHTNIISYMAAMPKGERLANLALWDDLHNLREDNKDPAKRSMGRLVTHTSIADGRQNGLFFQALTFGGKDTAQRLGRFMRPGEAKPLADMREKAHADFLDYLDKQNEGSPEKIAAWSSFFSAIKREVYQGDEAELAKDFFKQPLMEVSYSKDAGMFQNHLEQLFARPDIEPFVRDNLTSDLFPTMEDVSANANRAFEASLRQAIDASSVKFLTGVGYAAAMLNKPVIYKGSSGDDVVISPVSHVPTKLTTEANDYTTAEGFKFLNPQYNTVDMLDPLNLESLRSVRRREMNFDPGYSKPVEYFYDKASDSYQTYKTFAGAALSKQLGVLPNQFHDAAAMTLTVLMGSKNKAMPTPSVGVHDSIISTGSGSLRLRNVYNNIVIPSMAPAIADTFNRITEALRKAEADTLSFVKMKGVTGIGANGDHKAVGGYFDGLIHQWKDDSEYKERVFMRRLNKDGKPRTEADWKESQAKKMAVIKEAISYGYVPPGAVPDNVRDNMAVTSDEFVKLYELFKREANIDGNKPQVFAEAKRKAAEDTFKNLRNVTQNYGGINQMSSDGGAAPKKAADIEALINSRRIKEAPERGPEIKKDTPANTEVNNDKRIDSLLSNAFGASTVPPVQTGVPVAEPPGLFNDLD